MSIISFFSRSDATAISDPLDEACSPAGGDQPADRDVDALLTNSRYGLILNRRNSTCYDNHLQAVAWLALEQEMGLVPARQATDENEQASEQTVVGIPSFYLDRHAVTNEQFARFVSHGGYGQTDYWPQEIWPNLLQFVDSTGFAGPRFWRDGKCPRRQERHPVVGICWFEARAYALWCGKRLATSIEWQHAASWCAGKDGRGRESRYPWGNTFAPEKTNTWAAGSGKTVPADGLQKGCTPNGIYQLIGNVWEWVATQYQYEAGTSGFRVSFEQPMAEIRGGAFDTYFETQATSQFRTGQPFLYRADNVGFRCCLPADQLKAPPSPTAFD